MPIKSVIATTFTCDMPECVGGIGACRSTVTFESENRSPQPLPPGWTVVKWYDGVNTQQAPDVLVCGSCYSRIPKLLGFGTRVV